MKEREERFFQHIMDNGYLQVIVPERVSVADCYFIEQHFALILKQARRRATEDKP